jgi:G:T-mismatch repair DNA endonuclease (very short patch repair protein)
MKIRICDNTTLKGLKEAERLQRLGWRVGVVTPCTIEMIKDTKKESKNESLVIARD